MTSFLPNDERLSAYLDGEVTAHEREVVERALRDSPAARRSLEELRRLQAELRGLPRLRLEPDFCHEVLRQAQRTMLLEPKPHEHLIPGDASGIHAGADSSFVAQVPERRGGAAGSGDGHRGGHYGGYRGWRCGYRGWHRVAAALAVLAPALLLIVLAARDPYSGGTRVGDNTADEQAPTNNSAGDSAAQPAQADRQPDATTGYAESLDGRELDRQRLEQGGAPIVEGEGRRASGATAGRTVDRVDHSQGVIDSLSKKNGQESLNEADPSPAPVQKGGAESTTYRDAPAKPAVAKSAQAKSAQARYAPPMPPASAGPMLGNGKQPAARQLPAAQPADAPLADVYKEAGGSGGQIAADDNVLVVYLSVTETAWRSLVESSGGESGVRNNGVEKSGIDNGRIQKSDIEKWLLREAPALNGSLRVGKLTAADVLSMGRVEGGKSQAPTPRTADLRSLDQTKNEKADRSAKEEQERTEPEEKKGEEKKGNDKAGNNTGKGKESESKRTKSQDTRGKESDKEGDKEGDEERLAAGQRARLQLTPDAGAALQRFGAFDNATLRRDKDAADTNAINKTLLDEKKSVVQVEGAAEDVHALLRSLHAQAKAGQNVVSLAVMPPQQAGPYQAWSALNYAASVEQLRLGEAAGSGGFSLPSGFGGGHAGSAASEAFYERFMPDAAARGDAEVRDGKPGAKRSTEEGGEPAREGLVGKNDPKKRAIAPKDALAEDMPADNRDKAFGAKKAREAADGIKGAAGGLGAGGGGPPPAARDGSAPGGGGLPAKGTAPQPGEGKYAGKVSGSDPTATAGMPAAKPGPAATRPAPQEAPAPGGASGAKAPAKTESAKAAVRSGSIGRSFERSSGDSTAEAADDRAKLGGRPRALAEQAAGASAPGNQRPAAPSAPTGRVRAFFIVQVVPGAASAAKEAPAAKVAPQGK